MSVWQAFKELPLRRQLLVAVSFPLWAPVAFTAWLDRS